MSQNVVTDAQARAAEEVAKAAQRALAVFEKAGGYLTGVFGTVPHDLVGILGGDWLKVRRAENLVNMARKAKERMDARGIKTDQPPPLSLTLPLLTAAADESRDELQDIWARLMAAAADPNRQGSFRIQFIAIAKKLDPLDAVLLNALANKKVTKTPVEGQNWRKELPDKLGLSPDEITVSCVNLGELGLVDAPLQPEMHLSARGREFMRAIKD